MRFIAIVAVVAACVAYHACEGAVHVAKPLPVEQNATCGSDKKFYTRHEIWVDCFMRLGGMDAPRPGQLDVNKVQSSMDPHGSSDGGENRCPSSEAIISTSGSASSRPVPPRLFSAVISPLWMDGSHNTSLKRRPLASAWPTPTPFATHTTCASARRLLIATAVLQILCPRRWLVITSACHGGGASKQGRGEYNFIQSPRLRGHL